MQSASFLLYDYEFFKVICLSSKETRQYRL